MPRFSSDNGCAVEITNETAHEGAQCITMWHPGEKADGFGNLST
jgi:hypothetical protein